MKHQEAIQLIGRAVPPTSDPQQWADLGSGSGVFTLALAHLLPPGSTIHAIDRSAQSLPPSANGVDIVFRQADFERQVLPLHHLDGVLLANALHYCRDAKSVLHRLIASLHPDRHQFLIVEYDTVSADRWVPFPLPYERVEGLFKELGFNSIVKLAEHPSLFRRENLYSCLATGKPRPNKVESL